MTPPRRPPAGSFFHPRWAFRRDRLMSILRAIDDRRLLVADGCDGERRLERHPGTPPHRPAASPSESRPHQRPLAQAVSLRRSLRVRRSKSPRLVTHATIHASRVGVQGSGLAVDAGPETQLAVWFQRPTMYVRTQATIREEAVNGCIHSPFGSATGGTSSSLRTTRRDHLRHGNWTPGRPGLAQLRWNSSNGFASNRLASSIVLRMGDHNSSSSAMAEVGGTDVPSASWSFPTAPGRSSAPCRSKRRWIGTSPPSRAPPPQPQIPQQAAVPTVLTRSRIGSHGLQ